MQTFGGALENKLHEIAQGAKNNKAGQRKAQSELTKWMSSADTKAARGRFRDPMATVRT